jgi:hypothetical protein
MMPSCRNISSNAQFLAEGEHPGVIVPKEAPKGIGCGLVLLGFRVLEVTVAAAADAFLFGAVLLLEDVEVGFDAVVGDGLALEQLVEVLPLGLQPLVGVLPVGDDSDEPVHDLETPFHLLI